MSMLEYSTSNVVLPNELLSSVRVVYYFSYQINGMQFHCFDFLINSRRECNENSNSIVMIKKKKPANGPKSEVRKERVNSASW